MKPWTVIQTDELATWFEKLDDGAKEDIFAAVRILSEIGPTLNRPHVDTPKGARIKNLKELRVQSKGRPFRIIFAFDYKRNAILLMGGNKEGDKRFYETIIPKAEELFERHVKEIENGNNPKKSSPKKEKRR